MRSNAPRALVCSLMMAGAGALGPDVAHGQHVHPEPAAPAAGQQPQPPQPMYMRALGGGWNLMGMGQAIPLYSAGFGSDANDAVTESAFYLTQPNLMLSLESPGARFTFLTTVNLEGVTLEDGELTFGGWGEGFLDKRHPHTILHEAMLSLNFWDLRGGAWSISLGKGFAPYGTDDPMVRPAVKYPTNHHLSQILERYTINTAYVRGPWSIEAGMFAGAEPDGPYDFSNIDDFPNSWSARLIRRFGGTGTAAPWEVGASFGNVVEKHHDEDRTTKLVNGYVRHQRADRYVLVEASRADPDYDADWWSVLGEARLRHAGNEPYARLEVATRPEYEREGPVGTDGFFRYDHDAHPIGATRWLIATLGYARQLTGYPYQALPFVELQFHNVGNERGDILAREQYGTNNFFALSAGVRLHLGGRAERMGSYGVLDPMTNAMRSHHGEAGHMEHEGH